MNLNFELIVFYVFAGIMLFAALRVITVRNPVHAALFLVLTFFCCSALWLLLEAEFLGIALVLVYVGAVMVLFLFVVMMLDINISMSKEGFAKYFRVAALIGIVLLVEMWWLVSSEKFGLSSLEAPVRRAADYSNTEALGKVLYTDYVYPFEIAAAILLVAIIAAIVLTLRKGKGNKYQNPGQQITVKKEDRLKIIKMDAEKRK